MSIFTVLGIVILTAQAVHMVAEMVNCCKHIRINKLENDCCKDLL
jgi:hypothetical protein